MARAEIISIALGADLFKIEPSYKNLYVMLWRVAKIQDPLILHVKMDLYHFAL